VTGWDVWSPMFYWLIGIGNANRSYLKKLSIDLTKVCHEVMSIDQPGVRTRNDGE
jgi:hypothetical protein